eukprot:1140828-Pelagomonas_calceolata.AAC.2
MPEAAPPPPRGVTGQFLSLPLSNNALPFCSNAACAGLLMCMQLLFLRSAMLTMAFKRRCGVTEGP